MNMLGSWAIKNRWFLPGEIPLTNPSGQSLVKMIRVLANPISNAVTRYVISKGSGQLSLYSQIGFSHVCNKNSCNHRLVLTKVNLSYALWSLITVVNLLLRLSLGDDSYGGIAVDVWRVTAGSFPSPSVLYFQLDGVFFHLIGLAVFLVGPRFGFLQTLICHYKTI